MLKKNLFDLEHNRYLQYYTTLIILLFTYGIGVGIAFVTKQIDYTNHSQLTVLMAVSLAVLIPLLVLLLHYKTKMEETIDEIKKLKL